MLEIRLRRSRLYLLCEAVLLPPEDNVEGGRPCFEDPSRISVITPNVEALWRGGNEGGGPLEGVVFFLALSHCSTCKTDKIVFIQSQFSTSMIKVEKILKGSLNLIPSPSPAVKIQIIGSKSLHEV